MRIAVIIPAFNESENLPKLLLELQNFKSEIANIHPIVVNDCSKDNTVDICKTFNTDVIDLPVNLGIGGAVQTGMIYAYNQGFEYGLQLDGDGQHPPKEIEKLAKAMMKFEADIIIGSRFIDFEGFKSSNLRRLGINYLKLIINLLIGLKITDSTSGFRLYNKRALLAITKYYPDEYPEPEAIIYFHKNGLKIVETPVVMKGREAGKTSISFLNSIYYFWKVSLAILFSHLKS